MGQGEGAALSGQKGQIELVVGEGVEVFLPMAGLFDAGELPGRSCLMNACFGVEWKGEGVRRSFGHSRGSVARVSRGAATCRGWVSRPAAAEFWCPLL